MPLPRYPAHVDLLTGKPSPGNGRPAVPIPGRWCTCGHNHPKRHGTAFDGTISYAHDGLGREVPGGQCGSCPCDRFEAG